MRPTLFMKRTVSGTQTKGGLKGHRLDFKSVQNVHIFRTLPPLCVSSSLAGKEGGSDQIAGSKRVNAGGIPDQKFSACHLLATDQ